MVGISNVFSRSIYEIDAWRSCSFTSINDNYYHCCACDVVLTICFNFLGKLENKLGEDLRTKKLN